MNSQIWGVSSAGRAPALQAGGHRFDPGTLHQAIKNYELRITNYKLQMRNSSRDWLKSHENEISLSLLRLDNL